MNYDINYNKSEDLKNNNNFSSHKDYNLTFDGLNLNLFTNNTGLIFKNKEIITKNSYNNFVKKIEYLEPEIIIGKGKKEKQKEEKFFPKNYYNNKTNAIKKIIKLYNNEENNIKLTNNSKTNKTRLNISKESSNDIKEKNKLRNLNQIQIKTNINSISNLNSNLNTNLNTNSYSSTNTNFNNKLKKCSEDILCEYCSLQTFVCNKCSKNSIYNKEEDKCICKDGYFFDNISLSCEGK
jgi:hypothetical protein